MDLSNEGGHMFDLEWETLETAFGSDLAGQADRYVVVVGKDLVGVFDTYNAALEAGYKQCGLSPFLLKRLPPAGGSLKRRLPLARPVERRRDRRAFPRPLRFLIERLTP